FKSRRLDRLNLPACGEGIAKVFLRNASWSLGARSLVAEAGQKNAATGVQNRVEAVHVTNPVFIGEDMKQATVDHVIEALVPLGELQGIFDQEGGGKAPLGRFFSGGGDGLLHEIEAGDCVALAGKEQSVFPSAATAVEDRARDGVG